MIILSRIKDFYVKNFGYVTNIFYLLNGRRIFALVGKSGTGKSFRAKMIANHYHIEAIIDDGILIVDNKIIAGHTAKSELYYLQAVKVALFDDLSHRQDVVDAINKAGYKRILILGTSNKMVNKIRMHLKLPDFFKIIRIEDISSPKEIEAALKSRMQGNHVICVPGIEVKKDSSNIFYDSVKIFFNRTKFKIPLFKINHNMVEKSIVRPHFQDFKQELPIIINEIELKKAIKNLTREFDNSCKILKIKISNGRKGGYSVSLLLKAPRNKAFSYSLNSLQEYLLNGLEQNIKLKLEELDILIDKWVK